MERCMKCGFVVLAIVFISLNVNAQPSTSKEDSVTDDKLPPLIFPKDIVKIGSGLPPLHFPTENVTLVNSTVLIDNDKSTEKEKSAEIPPLIFPKTSETLPVVQIPPLLFPKETKAVINKTALDILTAAETNLTRENVQEDMHILQDADDDYYKDDSSEDSDHSYEVEDVQPIDKSPQKDNLEENFKSEMNLLPLVDEFDDDTDIDHPMLKDTHILGIIGGVLAILCVCLYLGIIIWRRTIFNRYGMRERLVNEDDFYSNRSIHHNF